jgi:heme-degrading monooxygenase HmoA
MEEDMYGTIARMRIKSGQETQLSDVSRQWEQERKGKARGFVTSYLLKPDQRPNERLLVAIFEDRQSYRANAEDPEQDKWYRRLRQHLESDPEWTDGEVEPVG